MSESSPPKGVVVAHYAAYVGEAPLELLTRERIEKSRAEGLPLPLSTGATIDTGSGNRAQEIPADSFQLPFERDAHRIQHSKPFRRLAGKCQVYIAPDNDHLRTRLTHAIEVAQVAETLAVHMGLNANLARAAALAHDCGHGPAGHASEEALSPYLPEGFDHAVYGADVVLVPLNLCSETLDAVRNHSWRRPAPSTPEGEIVSWADRIAYVCHDFEDAVAAGIVQRDELPSEVREVVGSDRSVQLSRFITAMLDTCAEHGIVGMRSSEADALQSFRNFNFQEIYLRPSLAEQVDRVIKLIRGLVDFYIENPQLSSEDAATIRPGTDEAKANAVQFVSGMTDRYAMGRAVEQLGWDVSALPQAIG